MSVRFYLGIGLEALTLFLVLPWITIQINQYLGLPIIQSTASLISGGVLLIIGASIVVLSTYTIFIKPRQVMISPSKSPPKLITSGLLEYSRNPMYWGYFFIVFAEFLLLGYVLLLAYFAALLLFVHLMVVYIEEPSLEEAFGVEYVEFKKRVPRWIPKCDS